MAEDAGAADLIAGGRLQLGISRGSPGQVIDGWRYFGYHSAEGENDEGMAGDTPRNFSNCYGLCWGRRPGSSVCPPGCRYVLLIFTCMGPFHGKVRITFRITPLSLGQKY